MAALGVISVRPVLWCLLFFLTISNNVEHGTALNSHLRHRRTVMSMCSLMFRYTNRRCTDYDRYGCFCGLGGAGIRPVDEVDWCCKRHDDCYAGVSCYILSPIFAPYDYECDGNNTCHCTDEDPCYRTTCECDLNFANCLHRHEFNSRYRNYDRRLCNVWAD